MDLKEGIEKLKGLIEKFSSEKPAEPVEVKFKDMKLQDGTTIISIDGEELAIGVPVYVMTPEGRLPAPDARLGGRYRGQSCCRWRLFGALRQYRQQHRPAPAFRGATQCRPGTGVDPL